MTVANHRRRRGWKRNYKLYWCERDQRGCRWGSSFIQNWCFFFLLKKIKLTCVEGHVCFSSPVEFHIKKKKKNSSAERLVKKNPVTLLMLLTSSSVWLVSLSECFLLGPPADTRPETHVNYSGFANQNNWCVTLSLCVCVPRSCSSTIVAKQLTCWV